MKTNALSHLASLNWDAFFGHRTVRNGECIEFTGAKDPKGYGRVGHNMKVYLAHRVSYQIVNGDIAPGMFVCHRCDNPSCINPEHLFAGTLRDNTDDMLAKGRSQKGRGETHSQVKLTSEQVKSIRLDTRIHREIAEEYGVATSYIANIKALRCWTDIDSPVVRMGYAKGERNPTAKLTREQAELIRADNRTFTDIGKEYGVSRVTVSNIKKGKVWRQ